MFVVGCVVSERNKNTIGVFRKKIKEDEPVFQADEPEQLRMKMQQ